MIGRNNQQIGVVSYGPDCPQTEEPIGPGVYSKISDNLAWINRVVAGSKHNNHEDRSEEDC